MEKFTILAKSFVGWLANKLIRFMVGKESKLLWTTFLQVSVFSKETPKVDVEIECPVIHLAMNEIEVPCELFEEKQKLLREKSNNIGLSLRQMRTCVNLDVETNISRQCAERISINFLLDVLLLDVLLLDDLLLDDLLLDEILNSEMYVIQNNI